MTFIYLNATQACDPWNPDPSVISVRSIADTLSKLCRFGGRTKRFYSVAQHSVLVADLVDVVTDFENPMLSLAALMHDAAEAFLGDIVTPIKRELVLLSSYQSLSTKEAEILKTIFNTLQIPWPSEVDWELIHGADKTACSTEFRDLMGNPVAMRFPRPCGGTIIPLDCDSASIAMVGRFNYLSTRGAK